MILKALYICLAIVGASDTQDGWLYPDQVVTACAMSSLLVQVSHDNSIDPYIMAALVHHESRWRPTAISHAGACGLTQVIPRFSGGYTCDQLQNPQLSLRVGSKLLRAWQVRKNRVRSIETALACYNVGGRCDSLASGRFYAAQIMSLAALLRREAALPPESVPFGIDLAFFGGALWTE